MASSAIHLAAANVYLKKHDIKNREEFLMGVISVDIAEDKFKSHYTKTRDTSDLLKYLEGKVQLNEFLKENSLDSDYNKGRYFHLITDYEFFNGFLDEEKLSELDFTTFKKQLYHDYGAINLDVKAKYNVVFPDVIKKDDGTNGETECFLIDTSKLDTFIETLGSIDLESYPVSKKRSHEL